MIEKCKINFHGNKLKVEIAETIEELKQQLKHQKKGQEKERLQMVYWLKSGQLTSRQELAHRLARNESTIYRWLKKYWYYFFVCLKNTPIFTLYQEILP
ncbi:helix-turn-helix domain-containing protein [Myxosarcina sp. GI1(2024)]